MNHYMIDELSHYLIMVQKQIKNRLETIDKRIKVSRSIFIKD